MKKMLGLAVAATLAVAGVGAVIAAPALAAAAKPAAVSGQSQTLPPDDPTAPNRPGHYFEVVVAAVDAVTPDPQNTRKFNEAKRRLPKVKVTTLDSASCRDAEKFETLGLNRQHTYNAIVLTFGSEPDARRFARAYKPGVYGVLKNENCTTYPS